MNMSTALLTTITCNKISVLDSVIKLPRSIAGVNVQRLLNKEL